MRLALPLSISLVLAFGCGPTERRRDDDEPARDAGDAGDSDSDAGNDAGFDGGFDGGSEAGRDAGSTGEMPAAPALAAVADATCSNGRLLKVYEASDGDTLKLTSRGADGLYERIRLVGVDTPESYPVSAAECYGPEAGTHTKALMNGQSFCLTYDPAVTTQSNNVDPYGRTLGYVFYGPDYRQFLNAELVWDGYARDFPFTDGAVFSDYLRGLKSSARTARRGLWGACQ